MVIEEETATVTEDETALELVDREADVEGSDNGNMADLLLFVGRTIHYERAKKRREKIEENGDNFYNRSKRLAWPTQQEPLMYILSACGILAHAPKDTTLVMEQHLRSFLLTQLNCIYSRARSSIPP